MLRIFSCSVVFLITINLLLSQQVRSLPLGQTLHEEVNDLPKSYTKTNVGQEEGITKTPVDLAKDENLKYDVEILESRPVKKENIEVEERFRGGPALQTNTNAFYGENIEMNVPKGNKNEGVLGGLKKHVQLAVILGLAGLVSIILYAVLLIWRSHYQQRYGMRELLLATGNNYYEPNNNPTNNTSESSNNPNNSVYNTTTQNLVLG